MTGEDEASDDASKLRRILERPSPDSVSLTFQPTDLDDDDSQNAPLQNRSPRRSTTTPVLHKQSRRKRRGGGGELDLAARQLSRLLAAEQYEAQDMRRAIIRAGESLERETQRAYDADARARAAEARAAKAQADAARLEEALKAHRSQLEGARNEIEKAQRIVDGLAKEKDAALEEASKERGKARAVTQEARVKEAKDVGVQEGKRQGFMEGRKEGWRIAMQEFYRGSYYAPSESFSTRDPITPPPFAPPPAGNGAGHSVPPGGPPASGPPPPSGPPPSGPPPVASGIPPIPRPLSAPGLPPAPGPPAFNPPPASGLPRGPPIGGPVPFPEPDLSDPAASSKIPRAGQSRRRGASTPYHPRSPISSPLPPLPGEPSRRPGSVISRPRSRSPSPVIPDNYIPLAENGNIVMPPPNRVGPLPPPSPRSPSMPLPNLPGASSGESLIPQIMVEEPTPPDALPRARSISRSDMERNVRPSQIRNAEGAGDKRKKKSRGRISPSPSSTDMTEMSQFDLFDERAEEERRRNRRSMSRGTGLRQSHPNGSELSIIHEAASAAERSPVPSPANAGPRSPRMGRDPREYELGMAPEEMHHMQTIADELRFTEDGERERMRRARAVPSDNVSVRSNTTHASSHYGPRRPKNVTMPKLLSKQAQGTGPGGMRSQTVRRLEKEAEAYDDTGSRFPPDRFPPNFGSETTPTPPNRSATRGTQGTDGSAPGITVQPPSRPTSAEANMLPRSPRVLANGVPLPDPVLPSVPDISPVIRSQSSEEGYSPANPLRGAPEPLYQGGVRARGGEAFVPDLNEFGPHPTPKMPPSHRGPITMPEPMPMIERVDDLPPGFMPMTPGQLPGQGVSGGPPGMGLQHKRSMSLGGRAPGDGRNSMVGRTPSGVPLPLSDGRTPHRQTMSLGGGALPDMGGHASPNMARGGAPPPTAGNKFGSGAMPNMGGGWRTPSAVPLPMSTATTARGLPAERDSDGWGGTAGDWGPPAGAGGPWGGESSGDGWGEAGGSGWGGEPPPLQPSPGPRPMSLYAGGPIKKR